MQPLPISADSAAHYQWAAGCEGWHLVRAASLSVIAERMAAGTREDRHWHARARQFFYVLDGTLEIEVEGATHQLPQGAGIEIPPGLAHQVRNVGDEVLNFLVISAPPHHGDRKEPE